MAKTPTTKKPKVKKVKPRDEEAQPERQPHKQQLAGACVCGKTSQINLPMPGRLSVMKIEVFCHTCKSLFEMKEN